MRSPRWLPLILALAALVACQRTTAPPVITDFHASQPLIDAGDSTTLLWTVTGTATLVLEPGVGDVTGLTQVVVSPPVTTTYTLTATNAGGSDSNTVTVTVDQGIDVQGVVLGLDGRPAPGVDVTVTGAGTETTGADGRFTIADVDTPYDIHVLHPAEPLVVTYVGLTRDDPVLLLSGAQTATAHVASFYGNVSAGTGFPQPANHVTRVTFASPATRLTVNADGATGDYQIVGLPWFGADTEGAMHALQWQTDAGGQPISYVGHGYRPLSLRAAIVGYLAQDMALLPVGEANVSGSVAVPLGATLLSRTASVVYPEGGWVTPASEVLPGSPFSYLMPTVPDASVTIMAAAQAAGGELCVAMRTGLTPGTSGVDVVVPAPPQLDGPADSVANVGYDTEFTWTAAAPSATLVTFNGPAGTLAHAVVTDDPTVTIPDLRELGLDLVAGGRYHWQVFGLPEFATVDEAASGEDGFLSSWILNAFYLPKRDGAIAASLQRQFTTVP